jgi:deazaflavin-dependent oxidoreductase (nitroreductase family)
MIANIMFKIFMRLQIVVFRLTKGRAMSAMRGMPILLLTTVGKKTGKHRTTPLMYLQDGGNYVITASNNGRDKHPAWFFNLQAAPQVQIEVPGKDLKVSAAVATQSERNRLWPQLVSKAPFFEAYQQNTTRPIPMVILRPR